MKNSISISTLKKLKASSSLRENYAINNNIYESLAQKVILFAKKINISPAIFEDVVAEVTNHVFTKIQNEFNIDRCDSNDEAAANNNLHAFLNRCINNKLIDIVRSSNYKKELSTLNYSTVGNDYSDDDYSEQHSDRLYSRIENEYRSDSPLDIIIGNELAEMAENHFQNDEMVYKVIFEDKSTKEVAEEYNVRPNYISVNKNRLLNSFKPVVMRNLENKSARIGLN